MCALGAVASPSRTAAAPFAHPVLCVPVAPLDPCPGWCAAAEALCPSRMDPALPGSLLYPGSSVRLARRRCSWDLSPFQMCLKLANVFKSN